MTQFCQTKSMIFKCLIVVILSSFMVIGCGQDSPTEPQITEEDVARIVAAEIAKMNGDDNAFTPQEIRQIALDAIASVDKNTC